MDITSNRKSIIEKIRIAADKSGRDPSAIKLMAATKSQGEERVVDAVAAGIHFLGENYVQEASRKYKALGNLAEWHLIGHLQRNKVRAALDIFSVIESLDSLGLAKCLSREGLQRGVDVRVFVEVNLAKERTKSGVSSSTLAPLMKQVDQLECLRVEGLMVIPPMSNNIEDSRPYFRELRKLANMVNDLSLHNVHVKELSMGMTRDYPIAVEEGATIVRIGTALFGARLRRQ